ncbi:hypothetical protein DCAR_0727504 [Daucus carota subsp. sativus]|uniref:Uncharacterized protein n=1 Tax=Daucus carota subsp. sativus TaxID=79200 RepID=A0A161ZIV6_DAUCS|nr:hypothetical protein DCAR_0727504 [Daucus carota subsp. sativus]
MLYTQIPFGGHCWRYYWINRGKKCDWEKGKADCSKVATEGYFPECFKQMTTKPYTIRIEINESNVFNKTGFYWATNVCHGFKLEESETEEQQSIQTQGTSSTTQLPGISVLN